MRKLFSIFAAMLVALAVSATPVVLPATLDVNNVTSREGLPDYVIEEGDYAGTYFDMGPNGSSNDTLLYADWDVTIQPMKYNLAVDVYNTNSWRVQLYLLNQAGDTLKSLRYKGSSEDKGQFAIGSIDMRDLEAGDYILRVRCATAWSALKLKDIIVEADYKGVSVALPGTLQPAYAELSANASVTNGAIAFKPSTAPDEYATWNVSFDQAGEFGVKIDYDASNTHTYSVALLSADGLTGIDTVAEASTWAKPGVKDLGAISVPAAGNYKVKLMNATQWSEAVLNSITFIAPQKLYLKPGIWYWEGNKEKFAIYSWADGVGDAWSDYMTLAEDETDIWTGTIPYNHDKVIFVRFGNKSTTPSWEDNMWNQTNDLTLEEGKDMYTITMTTWEGHSGNCPGEWSKYTHVEKPKFHISGSMTEWALIDSYADSYELDLKAGSYSLKVVTLENDWLGYAQLTQAYKAVELYPDEDDNVCFTLAADGKVTVTYIKDNVFKLEGDFVLPEIRLPGILSGLTLTPAENKLTASVTVELAANYGYSSKVVCATTWLGKAKNGDDYYEVTRDAATVDGLGWEGAEIIFRTDKAGNYTFTWTFATRALTVSYPDFDPEDGFYLVGTFDDVEEWGVESLNASKKFTWNKHIGEGNEEWKITVALHAGDRFKAVYVYRESIATWYPSGSGNDYVVDDNHAGASKTIYFQEKYNDEWGGHFYIEQNWPTAIDNSDAEIKVEKFFRDGQLIIRKNGVEYNAQGAIVK